MKTIRLWLVMALLALANVLKPKEEPDRVVLRVGERFAWEVFREAKTGGYEGSSARFFEDLRRRGELRRTARGMTFTPHALDA